MKNPFVARNWTFGKLLLWLWVIFSVVFISVTVWRSGLRTVYNMGRNEGQQATLMTLLQTATAKCEPFPVTLGQNAVHLINVACLQQPAEAQEGETSEDSE